MDARFNCPFCGKRIAIDRKWIGRKAQCPYCNSIYEFTEDIIGAGHNILANSSFANEHEYGFPKSNASNSPLPVGFWARVAGSLIDAIISIVIAVISGFALGMLFGSSIGNNADFVGQLIGICSSWLYSALMESSAIQATLGKLIVGAKVVDSNGDRLTFGRASGRHFAKYVSALILMVGYIMVAFDDRKRGLHDMIAGTYVVSR